jgi:hypothetical protein
VCMCVRARVREIVCERAGVCGCARAGGCAHVCVRVCAVCVCNNV